MTEALASAIWAVGIVVWAVIRWPYQRRARRRKTVRNAYDAEERSLLTGAVFGLFVIPLFHLTTGILKFADYPFQPALGWAGAVVMAVFLFIFFRCHRDLGRNFSVTLEIRQSHTLVTRGLYRFLRHPMYTSFLLWAVAQALLFPNWIVAASGMLSVLLLIFRRLDREEQMMLETFGDQYTAYRGRTYRLIPWIY